MNDEPIEVKTGVVYQNTHSHARGYFHFSPFGEDFGFGGS